MSDTPVTTTIRRIHSNLTEHLREDLAAALDVAMTLADASPEDLIEATHIISHLYGADDDRAKTDPSALGPQDALRRVRQEFGHKAFGVVTLFSIEAGSSLSGHAEALTSVGGLTSMDMTVRDLGWPEDRLDPAYAGDGQHWSEFELAALDRAVEAFKQAHPDVVMRTVTAIGYWSGGEVVITGVIDGRHDVRGGTDETGEGLFAESFTFDDAEPDEDAVIQRAIAAQYYD